MRLINIGFGNLVSAERLLTIVGPESAPDQAHHPGGAATAARSSTPRYGRKTRAVHPDGQQTMWCFRRSRRRPLQTALTPAKKQKTPLKRKPRMYK